MRAMTQDIIKPTVGRIVHFHQPRPTEQIDAPGTLRIPHNGDEPLAAIVTAVWSDTCVNLTVFDANGQSIPRTSVELVQPMAPVPGTTDYCCWMPYQIKKTTGTESGEKAAGTQVV